MRGSKRLWTLPNVVAALLIGAAGAVVWTGLNTGPGDRPAGASTAALTMAADPVDPGALQSHGSPAAAGLPTRIVAPSAGIDARISEVGLVKAEGKPAWETAWRSAGHHVNSARPGQPGNVVLTGHVSVIDAENIAVFRTLDQLQPGDVVEVYAGETVYRYAVKSTTVVPPSAVNVLRSNAQSRLTLITCTPDLKKRLVVTGELVQDL